jgi:uncharacterized damage-inducible protein DinB
MGFHELFLAQHAQTHTTEVGKPYLSTQDLVLRAVTEEQMRSRPQSGFNSLAWLLWHMTRAEDIGMNLIIKEKPQVLDKGDWMQRLNVSRRDLGTGMSSEEVDQFNDQINITALLAYRQTVGLSTQEILWDLKPEELEEVIDGDLTQHASDEGAFGPKAEWVAKRWEGKRKAFTLTWTVLGHSMFTFGEGYVVRGLLGLDSI